MLVTEFAKKYNFKGRDAQIAAKVYAGQTKTEAEWFNKLEKEFDFNDTEKLRKVREILAKKELKKTIEASKEAETESEETKTTETKSKPTTRKRTSTKKSTK